MVNLVANLVVREIGILLPNNQRQQRTLRVQKDVLPYVLCWLCPVPATLASISRMDSISTSCALGWQWMDGPTSACPAEDPIAWEKGIQTPMAQGRSTQIISIIKWFRTSRLSLKNFHCHSNSKIQAGRGRLPLSSRRTTLFIQNHPILS